jgi:LCP family protein required for cell wall assembly
MIGTGVTVLVIFAACLAGYGAFVVSQNLTLANMQISKQGGPELVEGQATPGFEQSPSTPMTGFNIPDVEPSLMPWDGAGRVTVLLMGLDYRDWETGIDYPRSDTMILLTLDPLAKTAGILSIPRDMWAAIPGFQHGKINTAYYLGDAHKLPGGGPGLAVKTVEQFLGVPINFYAQIDFDAFVKFIDEIGGVKINVPAPITVDLLGDGYRTKKKLQPGVQVLPGDIALAYARNRYTEGGDFDRAERQQQVILGIRNRILSFDMLPVLVDRKFDLYEDLASGVHTNMSLDQLVKLALIASQVPDENIKRGVIGKGHVLFGTSPDQLAILIPLADKIHALRDEIFASSGALGPQTPGTGLEQMLAEAARITVINQSSTAGLANGTQQYLTSQGLSITGVSEPLEGQSQTILIDHSGKPFTTRYLVDLIGINPANIQFDEDPGLGVDIELILGADWARKIPAP